MPTDKKTRPNHRVDDDYDDSPLTAAELERMRPAREVLPELVEAYKSGTLRIQGRLLSDIRKEKRQTALKKNVRARNGAAKTVNVRVPSDVIAAFKSQGADWQDRIGNVLKAVADVIR